MGNGRTNHAARDLLRISVRLDLDAIVSLPEIDRALQELGRHKGPIVAGPWLSEIGFELLYWIPFLRWCLSRGYLKRDNLTIVSRGGCRSWYGGMASDYRDILAVCTPQELCVLNEQRITDQAPHCRRFGKRPGQRTAKHLMSGPVDAEILRRLGLEQARICHPSLMYGMFRTYWKGVHPDMHIQRARMKAITPPPVPEGLPKDYVAVKFYQSQACNAGLPNSLMVNQVVRQLARESDVVLLHTKTRYDDHGEFHIDRNHRVHVRPFSIGSNLDEQTAIIGGARAFVGTYGGFAYLAPMLGIPTLALYGVRNFRTDHLHLMQGIAIKRFRVPFKVVPLEFGPAGVKQILAKQKHAA